MGYVERRFGKSPKVIAEMMERYPDQRLGQFIWNALALEEYWKAPEANALFYIEDTKMIDALRSMERKFRQTGNAG